VEGTRSYWLDLFTSKTWQEFLEAGAKVSGFRERRWRIIQRIKLGDYLLCYLTGVPRFLGSWRSRPNSSGTLLQFGLRPLEPTDEYGWLAIYQQTVQPLSQGAVLGPREWGTALERF
jgi:hypothetical protein